MASTQGAPEAHLDDCNSIGSQIARNVILPELVANEQSWQTVLEDPRIHPGLRPYLTFVKFGWNLNPYALKSMKLPDIPLSIANRPVILTPTALDPIRQSMAPVLEIQDPLADAPLNLMEPLANTILQAAEETFGAMGYLFLFNGVVIVLYRSTDEADAVRESLPWKFGGLDVYVNTMQSIESCSNGPNNGNFQGPGEGQPQAIAPREAAVGVAPGPLSLHMGQEIKINGVLTADDGPLEIHKLKKYRNQIVSVLADASCASLGVAVQTGMGPRLVTVSHLPLLHAKYTNAGIAKLKLVKHHKVHPVGLDVYVSGSEMPVSVVRSSLAPF